MNDKSKSHQPGHRVHLDAPVGRVVTVRRPDPSGPFRVYVDDRCVGTGTRAGCEALRAELEADATKTQAVWQVFADEPPDDLLPGWCCLRCDWKQEANLPEPPFEEKACGCCWDYLCPKCGGLVEAANVKGETQT